MGPDMVSKQDGVSMCAVGYGFYYQSMKLLIVTIDISCKLDKTLHSDTHPTPQTTRKYTVLKGNLILAFAGYLANNSCFGKICVEEFIKKRWKNNVGFLLKESNNSSSLAYISALLISGKSAGYSESEL